MKQITRKTLKSFFATTIITGAFVLGASAQQAIQTTGTIVSEVKVKETNIGNALLDLAISNKSASPLLVIIRDESGSVVFEYDGRSRHRRALSHRLRYFELRGNGAINFEKLAGLV